MLLHQSLNTAKFRNPVRFARTLIRRILHEVQAVEGLPLEPMAATDAACLIFRWRHRGRLAPQYLWLGAY